MFAVIYRGFIYPDKEEQYEQAWHYIANYFIQQCGALGATLHRTKEGEYIAYSRWPDRQTRHAVWGEHAKQLPDHIASVIEELKSCINLNKPYDEIGLDVIEELLARK